jgi:predicted O-methyltransferase YrrM
LKDFESLWHYINHRNLPVVQDHDELEHVFNLMNDCSSYLEVGSAEGSSLYVLSQAIKTPSTVAYVERDKYGTKIARSEVELILNEKITYFHPIEENSHSSSAIREALCYSKYDVVMIDGDHTYEGVIADAIAYGHMAKKYIIFHDLIIDSVRLAFKWYTMTNKLDYYEFGNKYIYGVIKL